MIKQLPVTRRLAATLATCAFAAMVVSAAVGSTATAAIVPDRRPRHLGELLRPRRLDGHEHRAERPGQQPRPLSGYVDHRLPTRARAAPERPTRPMPPPQQAQSDLTAAYLEAEGRPITATTTADLAGQILQGGVYAGAEPRSAHPQRHPHPRRRRRPEHRVHLPDQLDPEHRLGQHGCADQRRTGVQRLLAGRKLRHARHGLDRSSATSWRSPRSR